VPVTRGFKGVLLGFATMALACGELSTTPGADAGTDGGTVSTRLRCTPNECADEFTCSVGECVSRCSVSSVTCFSDEYCVADRTCEPKRRLTCDELSCNTDQVCANGVCTTTNGSDTCAADGDCLTRTTCDPDLRRCVAAVPCNDDGSCHTGPRGAVCIVTFSTVAVPLHHCAPGSCRTNDHCPAPKTCVEIGAVHPSLGVCR